MRVNQKKMEAINSILAKVNLYSTRLKELYLILLFLISKKYKILAKEKLVLIKKAYQISAKIQSPHRQYEIFHFLLTVLENKGKKGCFVEAGVFKGSSSAKFSLAVSMTNNQLYLFDSYEGIPKNTEKHGKNIFGLSAKFPKGSYKGRIEEVKENIKNHGNIKVCRFRKGWFDKTMPRFKQRILAAYIDVDLALSTKTCLKYLYPLLQPGGVIFTQDGHLPLVIKVLDNDDFWENEVGYKKPIIKGLYREKLVKIIKPKGAKRILKNKK